MLNPSAGKRIVQVLEDAMTENAKLPRRLSEEPSPLKPRRPSHEKVIEQLDRWANSPELQPPTLPDAKTI
jgi:hypothetical protein